jgi:hypothetical protein
MNFIFNDFKRRFLNGEVPSADTWYYIPVSDTFKEKFEFDDYKLEQYRTLFDFKDVSDTFITDHDKFNAFSFADAPTATDGKGKLKYVDMTSDKLKVCGTSFLNGSRVNHIWTKVIDDETFQNKPMFINELNYEDFKLYYANSIKNNTYIDSYVKNGFYFIRSKEELEWFAERSKTNSTIIGVIGDNIEGVIDKPIGPDDKYPFNGILDGNYFTLDIWIKAKNVDNGLVGVLGPQGIVRNIKLIHSDENKDSIECLMPINLGYIKKDGRDINCGLLVGRSYGLVENIDASELKTFNLYGFVPSVYSVTNKSDNYRWNEETNIIRKKFDYNNENYYFSNSFCINSPGNICPYVGYFAEGKFFDDAAAVCLDTSAAYFSHSPHSTITGCSSYFINLHNTAAQYGIDLSGDANGFEYNPLGLYVSDTNGLAFISNSSIDNADYYIMSPLYYGLDSKGHWTTRNIGPKYESPGIVGDYVSLNKSVICYNTNLIKDVFQSNITSANEPAYEMTRCSMRMHPQARVAYNVGTLIGANYGSAWKIDVSAIIKNTSNFVGFIGGLAGKQSEGFISGVNVSIDNQFNYEIGVDPKSGGVVYYKQTPILPSSVNVLYQQLQTDNKEKIYEKYFSAWYDKGATDDDNKVNTAQNITVDVITYKLRPIFVAGGLFGRYIPSYDKDCVNGSMGGCKLDNVNVIYNDNYTDSALANIAKSKENAFGVIIGKVDYSTLTNSTMYNVSLTCENSQFYSKSNVGEPFKVYPIEHNQEFNIDLPKTKIIADDTSACVEEFINTKYVGIYELKFNVLDSVAYNATNSNVVTTVDNTQKLSNMGIFDICDYPIDLTSHYGGILPNHNLNHFMNSAMTETVNGSTYTSMNYSAYNGTVYSGYDHWHQYYQAPNVDFTKLPCDNSNTNPAGYNKKNVAQSIIWINPQNCYSNVSNYIQLYDDYVNNWNLNKLPTVYNTFNNSSVLYAISKWWFYYRTNGNTMCKLFVTDELRKSLGWDETSASWGFYSNWFFPGLDYQNINMTLMNGIQNTFDGYTTIEYRANNAPSAMSAIYNNYDGIPDCFWYLGDKTHTNSNFSKSINYLNCLIYKNNETTHENEIIYQTNKLFVKNIMSTPSVNFYSNLITDLEFNQKASDWNNKDRNEKDTYFYYSYTNKIDSPNEITTKYVPLQSAFAFNYKVNYSSYYDKMGYFTDYLPNDALQAEDEYSEMGEKIQVIQDNITVGEYYTPIQIREHLSGDENPTFTTTSVSSKNKFAGILVVDSSGRNVMYYDNENATQLTGNSVYFPCHTYPIPNKKFLLEIK